MLNTKSPQPRRTVKVTTRAEQTTEENAFTNLIPELRRAIEKMGYKTPSPIQEQSIPHLLEGRDLLGIAQTGTGKTAAFSLPLLQRLAEDKKRPAKGTPRALVLAPTRELAAQIGESIVSYSSFMSLRSTVIFGGVKQGRQVDALNRGVDILVATPGRLLDLVNQGFIHLEKIEYFVLDEVDRMLDMGFIHDINKVLAIIPKKRQTLFFSATLAPKMETMAKTMVSNPIRVDIAPEQPTVERIDQKLLFVDKVNKPQLLTNILEDGNINRVIVFTQMKHVANLVVKKLEGNGISSAAIHGNKSQAARVKALQRFKSGDMRVLVATDVAARGIDVDKVTHVVNYDLPVEAETYVHRIGRTARAGENGQAISFCSAEEMAYLKGIEKLIRNPIPQDRDHPYHSEEARHSNLPAPKQGGDGRQARGSRPGQNRGGGGGQNRNSNRGQRRY